jgi:hypothetical protein
MEEMASRMSELIDSNASYFPETTYNSILHYSRSVLASLNKFIDHSLYVTDCKRRPDAERDEEKQGKARQGKARQGNAMQCKAMAPNHIFCSSSPWLECLASQ